MILRRNFANQTVELGPIRNDSGVAITTDVSAFVNNASGAGTLVHRAVGIWSYTFTQAETNASLVALRLTAATGGIAQTYSTLATTANGEVSATIAQTLEVVVASIKDWEGDIRTIETPSGSRYALDNAAIQAKTDNLPSDPADASVIAGLIADLTALIRQSNVATEVDSSTIKLNVASTKAKSHNVTGNLTGKTLKLYIETAPGVFFAEVTATGANGSFSFTPSSALTEKTRTFSAALREPSDGNNVLWKGSIEVAYAAKAE